jgi:hypothetical protein
MGKLMTAALLVAILLPGCAAKPDTAIAGYTCPFAHEVRSAQRQQAQALPLGPQARRALAGCTPYTVAEERARQEQLDSCHLLSGNRAPREQPEP